MTTINNKKNIIFVIQFKIKEDMKKLIYSIGVLALIMLSGCNKEDNAPQEVIKFELSVGNEITAAETYQQKYLNEKKQNKEYKNDSLLYSYHVQLATTLVDINMYGKVAILYGRKVALIDIIIKTTTDPIEKQNYTDILYPKKN